MSLKLKILTLAILPLLLVTASITLIELYQARALGEQEVRIFEINLLDSKKAELKNYLSLALTSISHVKGIPEHDPEVAQLQIKSILRNLTYGDDGYFFVYDNKGVNLVHPLQPELEGSNLSDLQDQNGDFIIRNLLQRAREGGGFHRYQWQKPSTGEVVDKLSYVVQLPGWKWMLGTGLYVDDIAREMAKIRAEVDRNIRETFFTVLAITSVVVIIIVLTGIAFNLHEHLMADARLRALAHRYMQLQVSERRRFSRELHDGINQLMVSVKYRLELAMERINGINIETHDHDHDHDHNHDNDRDGDRIKDSDNASEALKDLQRGNLVLNEAIQEVRRISHDLRPSLLDDLGLIAALSNLLNEFSERTGVRVVRTLSSDTRHLPDQIEITLYRVVQESLTNIERHADASVICLKTHRDADSIHLSISDNGCGFSPQPYADHPGIGLRTMRERIELLGGIFNITSEPGNGTSIHAQLSLSGKPASERPGIWKRR